MSHHLHSCPHNVVHNTKDIGSSSLLIRSSFLPQLSLQGCFTLSSLIIIAMLLSCCFVLFILSVAYHLLVIISLSCCCCSFLSFSFDCNVIINLKSYKDIMILFIRMKQSFVHNAIVNLINYKHIMFIFFRT